MKLRICSFLLLLLFITPGFVEAKKKVDLNEWPEEASPERVGRIIAKRFIESPYFSNGKEGPPKYITYPEVCTWWGTLRFAGIQNDYVLIEELEERFIPLLVENRKMIPPHFHVDYNVFGTIPLQLYQYTNNKVYKNLGLFMADTQWEIPAVLEAPAKPELRNEYQAYADQELSWQTRYWIDDMFMISAIQLEAYKVTKDKKYIERAALEMNAYLDKIQRPNGLFYHAPEVPFFWGRGNGWMAVGMADLLSELAEDNPYHKRIMESYVMMMETLRSYQRSDGMWGQLVDVPESWAETSGTGMFTYAMIKGIKNGWLDSKKYIPVVRNAWISLVKYIDENGDVTDVCQGTNAKADKQYYLDRKRVTGDMHGQAPVMWCVVALLEE